MALPPQIAVPHEIRCEVFLSVLSHFPKILPRKTVLNNVATVSTKLSLLDNKALVTFIPKPKPTTET
ncbi:hypothetical protein D3C84_1220480 [compost metagenome]